MITRDRKIPNTSSFIVQETHYDPLGLELTGLGFQAGGGVKVNRYLYNGTEIQNDHNLGLYDYEARFYDPVRSIVTKLCLKQIYPLNQHWRGCWGGLFSI